MTTENAWTITDPFDTLLLKCWSREHLESLRDSINGLNVAEIVEELTPNRNIEEYYRLNVLHETFDTFHRQRNLCDKYQYCQNVTQHSIGLACVTAASIKKRLSINFPDRLGTINCIPFQKNVIKCVKYVPKRKNIGILVFDFENDANPLRNHSMEVLYGNFYLYTTPTISRIQNDEANRPRRNEIVNFILKQISRNTDCVIIFVDQTMGDRWKDNSDSLKKIVLNSLCWNFQIRIAILSVSPEADEMAIEIYQSIIPLKPIVFMYHQLAMAPSGGLISLVEKSCRLNVRDAFMKYWLRGLVVFRLSRIDGSEDNNPETESLSNRA